ncbi:hypothetical protein Tco_1434885, partial [Tanacetum coccineum]
MQRSHGVKKDLLYRLPRISLYYGAWILIFLASFVSSGNNPLSRSWESRNIATFAISISWAIRRPASNALYSASLFVVSNSKRKAVSTYCLNLKGISTKKSAGVSFSFLLRNTISCSPNSIAHLATLPIFLGP